MGNFFGTAIKGTQEFGRAMAISRAIIGTIVGVFIIGFGIYLLDKKNIYTKKIVGMITDASCQRMIEDKKIEYDCTLTVKYVINAKTYTSVLSDTLDSPLKKGQSIELMYDPTDPNKVRIDTSFPRKYFGWGAIIFGILAIVGVWLTVWVTRKSKMAALLEGVGTLT